MSGKVRAHPASQDRAATPSGPSPETVSGVAGIPCAAPDRIWIAVTGGRGYGDYGHVKRVLDEERPGVVVQGECPYGGVDLLAKRWCKKNGVPCIGVEALWDFYGNPAGPIRNGWMFDLFPIYKLVAFPGDRGTANAVKQAYDREMLVRDERKPA